MNLETVMMVEPWVWFLVWFMGVGLFAIPSAIVANNTPASITLTFLWPVAWPAWALWRIGRWVFRGRRAREPVAAPEPQVRNPFTDPRAGDEVLRQSGTTIYRYTVTAVRDGIVFTTYQREGETGPVGMALSENWPAGSWAVDPSYAEFASKVVKRADDAPDVLPPNPWGAEGYQRAYKGVHFHIDPNDVVFYPSGAARFGFSHRWGKHCTSEDDAKKGTRLPDAEALSLWASRPAAVGDAEVRPTPTAYRLSDDQAAGLRADVHGLEKRVERLEREL